MAKVVGSAFALGGIALFNLGFVPAAFADVVPMAIWQAVLPAGASGPSSVPLSSSGSTTYPGNGSPYSYSLSESGFPDPTLIAQESGGEGMLIEGILQYYFEFVGPTASFIPVDVNAVATLSAKADPGGGSAGSESAIQLLTPDGVSLFYDSWTANEDISSNYSYSKNPGTIYDDRLVDLQPNTIYQIAMYATAETLGGSASASIDPMIYIDPSFADPTDYSIVLSNGIGDPSGVPEPGTWAMMLVGFGLVGAQLKRCGFKNAA